MYFAPPNFKTWLRAWWQPKEAKAKAKKRPKQKKAKVHWTSSTELFSVTFYCKGILPKDEAVGHQ